MLDDDYADGWDAADTYDLATGPADPHRRGGAR